MEGVVGEEDIGRRSAVLQAGPAAGHHHAGACSFGRFRDDRGKTPGGFQLYAAKAHIHRRLAGPDECLQLWLQRSVLVVETVAGIVIPEPSLVPCGTGRGERFVVGQEGCAVACVVTYRAGDGCQPQRFSFIVEQSPQQVA